MLICPRSPWVLVCNEDSSVRIPRPCGTYRCECCRPAKVNERVRVTAWPLARMDVVRMVTLTQVPGNWQRARGQVRDLARRVRKKFALEWAWAIEENPRGTGYHAHAMQWGEYLPQSQLQDMWGDRIVHIMQVGKGTAGYLTKCAAVAGYLSKNIADHLAVNGGRAIHMTRGYLGGWTSREVLHEMSAGKKWHIEHATDEEKANTMPRRWEEVNNLTSE